MEVLVDTAGIVSTTAGTLAVAVAQCSEIMLTPLTTTLLLEAPELVAVVFCPVTAMSWPTCGLRSTALLVTL